MALKTGRSHKEYTRVLANTTKHATPATGKLAREMAKTNGEGDSAAEQQPDYSKTRSLTAIRFLNHDTVDEVDERKEFGNMIV